MRVNFVLSEVATGLRRNLTMTVAMILTTARLGLRISDLRRLELGDLDWRAGTVTVRGKGNKTRLVPFGEEARTWIERYLKDGRAVILNGQIDDALRGLVDRPLSAKAAKTATVTAT